MARSQPGILGPVPSDGRFLVFEMDEGLDPRPALARLRDSTALDRGAVGIGLPLALSLGREIAGLRAFPPVVGPGLAFPSTQGALWVFIGGSGYGDVFERAASIREAVGDGFRLSEEVAGFRHREGRDLSGYLDGTANPVGDAAAAAALVAGRGPGLDASSFCAVQKYVHDLRRFATFSGKERDHIVGRRLADNEEIPDAPEFAHVKRAEQESYDPPAFMLRRSMPWGGVEEHGLYFVAYGESLDRFERVLSRMAGYDDGIVDGLLRFTRAVTGGYYWCPPLRDGKLDWSALGL